MLFLAFQLKINETNVFIKVAQGQSTKLNKIFSLICLGTGLPVHNKIIQVVARKSEESESEGLESNTRSDTCLYTV